MVKIKKYQCEKCSKVYSHRQHLYRHKQQCIKSVSLICNNCSKSFPRSDSLKKHRLICSSKKSSAKKNKTCAICQKEFIKVWHLERHLKIHSKSKSIYQCNKCEKTYTRETFYKSHIQSCDKRPRRSLNTSNGFVPSNNNVSATYDNIVTDDVDLSDNEYEVTFNMRFIYLLLMLYCFSNAKKILRNFSSTDRT